MTSSSSADQPQTTPPTPFAERWERALAQEPTTPEADIYKQVGKQSWPYVDQTKPAPRRPSPPGPASVGAEPAPKPRPLAPGEAAHAE